MTEQEQDALKIFGCVRGGKIIILLLSKSYIQYKLLLLLPGEFHIDAFKPENVL